MLKIKSHTNEFTIIFLRRLERKRMLKRSHSTSVQFSIPSSFLLLFFFFSFLVSTLFCSSPLFLFSFGAPFCFSVPHFSPALLFLFFRCVALYFSAQNTFFSPNVFQPKSFFTSATLLFFFFLLYSFLVQPSFFFISVSGLLFFLFFSSIYPRPNVLSSCFTSLLFE